MVQLQVSFCGLCFGAVHPCPPREPKVQTDTFSFHSFRTDLNDQAGGFPPVTTATGRRILVPLDTYRVDRRGFLTEWNDFCFSATYWIGSVYNPVRKNPQKRASFLADPPPRTIAQFSQTAYLYFGSSAERAADNRVDNAHLCFLRPAGAVSIGPGPHRPRRRPRTRSFCRKITTNDRVRGRGRSRRLRASDDHPLAARKTLSTVMSAGVSPLIRSAWPSERGRRAWSFWRAS